MAGFTLIEVMIVVAIVGILTAIAYPSYQEYVRKSKRADARTQLLEAAQYMQRFYSQNDRFDLVNDGGSTAVDLPAPLKTVPRGSAAGEQDYNISLKSVDSRTFTLQAVPAAGSMMASDKCGTFQINNVGQRTLDGATATVESCWK